jgi:hypothetical protein
MFGQKSKENTACIVTILLASISHGYGSTASYTAESSIPPIWRWQNANFARSGRIWNAPMLPKAMPVLHPWWNAYEATLSGADSTKVNKRAVIDKLKATWFGIETLPLRTVKPSQVSAWLSKHYGRWSAAYYNLALV